MVLTGDAQIAALNKQWRHKDKPTDVLSFGQITVPKYTKIGAPPKNPQQLCVLGDVVVSMETAYRQACEQNHSLLVEVSRLLIHGVLHLLGHDHVHGGLMARRMQQEEARLMASLHSKGNFKTHG